MVWALDGQGSDHLGPLISSKPLESVIAARCTHYSLREGEERIQRIDPCVEPNTVVLGCDEIESEVWFTRGQLQLVYRGCVGLLE